MNKVFPDISNIFDICTTGLTLISSFTENAPFGIGTLIKTIETIFTNIKQATDNNEKIKQILKDIIALLNILSKISYLSDEYNYLTLTINILNEDIIYFNQIYDNMNKFDKIQSCIYSQTYKGKLDNIIIRLTSSKMTLNVALTATLTNCSYHIIPYTKTKSACPCLKPDLPKPDQCMLINQKTEKRCETMFPKYKLISIKGDDSEKIVYYCCGHCAPNKGNSWWKKTYKRFEV